MVEDRTPDAFFPTDCQITLWRKGAEPQTITTEVTNFSDGGGGKETETVAHFGDAYLTVKQPQENFEVSFDVDINDTTWAQVMSYDVATAGSSGSANATKVVSAGEQLPYKIKLEWLDSEYPAEVGSEPGEVGAGYKILYYNAYGVSFEKENSADSRLNGTVTFRVSPSDSNARGQKYEIECDNFEDSVASGSYNSWEGTADTDFGY